MRCNLACWGVLLAFTSACGGAGTVPRARAPALSDDEARCREAARRETPLLTEWSSAEKANLQARLNSGAMAVEYTGCNMRPLPACNLRGTYRFQRTTLSSDVVDIRSEDELFTKLPLGAVNLEGELARSGHLQVRTTVSGQYMLEGMSAEDVPDYGACAQATHILNGISIGSFQLQSGDQIQASASVEILERGGGATTASSESVLRQAGNPQSCSESTDEAPHLDCSSPIQAFLVPLPRFARERGAGTVKATFATGDSTVAWELRSDQKFVCRTPCSLWINPGDSYEFRKENGVELTTIPVPDLRPYAGAGQVEVVAYDRKAGRFITGIALTGVGGGFMFMGGFLALAGALGEEQGLAIAGATTAGLGLVTLVPGIYLMTTSGSRTEVFTPDGQVATPRQAGLRFDF